MVRADVQALGIAIDACADPTALLQTLETTIARLPSGELRKMLRVAVANMRRGFGELNTAASASIRATAATTEGYRPVAFFRFRENSETPAADLAASVR